MERQADSFMSHKAVGECSRAVHEEMHGAIEQMYRDKNDTL